ncbi:DNA replication protein psf2 [Linderina pennispora]|nr:DNA replication protein psf2 [Linderina pennispora]
MSITHRQQEGFTLPELEYLAQSEPITIVPLYRMERVELVSGPIGPFRPPQKTSVPLWLAVQLKRSSRCRIVAPNWLSADHLQKLVRKEEQPYSRFTKLPMHYLEIAHILLTCAEDDLIEPQNIRRLLQDLREVRQGKVRQGLALLNPLQLQMDNLSMAEINEIRPVFRHSFDMLRQLETLEREATARQHESQPMEDAGDDPFSSSSFYPSM